MAGQGLNLGLADAQSLANVMLEGMKTGEDLGHPLLLERYERERYKRNAGMLMVCDGINRMFRGVPGMGPLGTLPEMGMNVVNRLEHVKQLIMRVAS